MSFWSDNHLLETGGKPEVLLKKIARLTRWSTDRLFVWRGQPDESWGLNSALFDRIDASDDAGPTETRMREVEARIFSAALRRELGGPLSTTPLERFSVLQHHGTATRLLDITRDPMIALWFACSDPARADKIGILFAIEVSKARVLDWDENRSIPDLVDDLGADQLGVYWPRESDARIVVQRSGFVFGQVPGGGANDIPASVPIRVKGWTKERLAQVFGKRGKGRPLLPAVLAISVAPGTKPKILDILDRSYGYTQETIYPDLDGFSRANGRLAPL